MVEFAYFQSWHVGSDSPAGGAQVLSEQVRSWAAGSPCWAMSSFQAESRFFHLCSHDAVTKPIQAQFQDIIFFQIFLFLEHP